MSENENIEAKLCSYVEGDLDAQGRAEIEKYLLANPQYLPLIKELSRTRGLLRDLPRATAPAELLETLSGQIERSALLGSDDPGTMRVHSNRAPQLAAWAAVLLLMTGLAAVVYRVLPANKTPPEVALLKAAPQQPIASTQNFANEFQKSPDQNLLDQKLSDQKLSDQKSPDQESQVAMAPNASAQVQSIVPMAAAPALSEVPAAHLDADAAIAPETSVATAPAINSATVVMDGTVAGNRMFAQSDFAGAITGGDATRQGQNMYVTLHAIDAKVANARLTAYLNDKQIAFDSHADNTADTGEARSFLDSRRLMPTSIAFAKDTISESPDVLNKSVPSNSNVALEGFDPARLRAATSPSASAMAFASTQKQSTSEGGGNVIVARNLSPQQVKSLTDDLAIQILPADQSSAASTQPAVDTAASPASAIVLKSGDALHIVARDNGLPGVEAMDEQQTIDGDGNVTLPLVGKVKAAGLSEAQLAEKIPQVYRDAKSPTTATWGIDRVASPIVAAPGAIPGPTTNAGTSVTTDAASVLPSTAPTVLTLDKAAEIVAPANQAGNQPGVDVTIRVLGQSMSATLPTTQQSLDAGGLAMPADPTTVPASTLPTTLPQ